MFELRANDNPSAMPLGTATISRHRTLTAARNAADRESRSFRRSVYATGGGYLQRVIVEMDSAGQVIERCETWRDDLDD